MMACAESANSAERHNLEATRLFLDRDALDALLAQEGLDGKALRHSHPHLFAETFVFVSALAMRRMARLIAAIESVIALPAYRADVLAQAPDVARFDPGYPAVCTAHDFHLTPKGPRLIEINTNAGGLLLNARLAQSQHAQIAALAGKIPGFSPRQNTETAEEILAMFQSAWRAYRAKYQGDPILKRLVIVDAHPESQFLAPEFFLFQRLLSAAGIETRIADPSQFSWDGRVLRHDGDPVDMVYNRLTDFALAAPELAPLREAYCAGGVALTPHPHAHALYADKRNLTLLSDPAWLAHAGVDAQTRELLLAGIPRTIRVETWTPEDFWRTRKQWFFKPATGFGSRAVYRGDKLTRRVFEEILAGNYVAQALEPPSIRRFMRAGECLELKLDLRNYSNRFLENCRPQAPLLVAARLYQGQTTNSRTPGGGFAVPLEIEE
jgi:hypothetical protein